MRKPWGFWRRMQWFCFLVKVNSVFPLSLSLCALFPLSFLCPVLFLVCSWAFPIIQFFSPTLIFILCLHYSSPKRTHMPFGLFLLYPVFGLVWFYLHACVCFSVSLRVCLFFCVASFYGRTLIILTFSTSNHSSWAAASLQSSSSHSLLSRPILEASL